MTDDAVLSIGQFAGAWRLMCRGSAKVSAVADGGIHYVFSGCPIPFFNVALLTERSVSTAELKAEGNRACAWAADKGVGWLFIVTHEALEPGTDAPAILDGCGLAPMMPLTGMIADSVARGADIDGLQLTVPQDDDACAGLLHVNGRAYGMDLDAGRDLIGKRSFWMDHFPVLGLTDGRPASCAGVMMVDGYRYVALVATDPSQQRRGYAEAAMRHALALSADVHGERPTVLHATDAGRPIYERMGYRPISTHTVFMEKKFLGG